VANSSISIGEFDGDSFDLDAPLVIRECPNDEEYPLALEGVTIDGHDVSISLSKNDVNRFYLYFS